ncbi:hypothetical protein M486_4275 (plasmid) [Yersinia pestis 1045]|nr:hypothetical protein CH59_4424 [Yersinia pestis]AJJ05030.1 hypothetical protein BZ20_4182 [Yersinia pseudotuberculosis]AJJ86179.1 hypothetical protein CH56_4320 [Yersinia pestis Angola]AJJ86371.1 hypothetical protein AK38_4279 [Yersinia pestis CO92]AJK10448.1 hypothetical protein CH60_4307 [Yersinia pestis str. Pestoides B]AJK22606.1 hypothetical protein CH43_4299 [Yersinia pestis Pestoides G]AKS59903.1 hypothetical protein M478_4226 [Yersinia pestis 2944]AKS79115.1 hypothetical protein M
MQLSDYIDSVYGTAVSERRSHIVNSLPLSHSGLSQYNEPEVKYDDTVFS